MRHFILTIICILTASVLVAQNITIETESVTLDNLISFIVEEIEQKESDDQDNSEHITFLLQTSLSGLHNEEKVILKQAFKLLADRLSDNDYISILTYSGFSGTALTRSSPSDLKTITYTIEHLKPSVKELQSNGIEHAYAYAEEHYLEEGKNTIVMVRNPKSSRPTENAVATEKQSKNNGNVALITAIALLPELISVIKD